MSFWRQLRFLLWKNFLIRSRQKVWALAEFVCPLILFLILVWLRQQNTTEPHQQCHYDARAMPSTGFIPFMQSYFCTLKNKCNFNATLDSDIGPANNPDNNVLGVIGGYVTTYLNNSGFLANLRLGLLAAKEIPETSDEIDMLMKNFSYAAKFFGIWEQVDDYLEPVAVLSWNASQNVSAGGKGDLINMFTCGELTKSLDSMFTPKSTAERIRERFKGKSSLLEDEINERAQIKGAVQWPPENITITTICNGRYTVEPSLDLKCMAWLQSFKGLNKPFLQPFIAMLRGFIVVSPHNDATVKVVAKLEKLMQAFNMFKLGVLDFYYNADVYQDALANSTLGKKFWALHDFLNSSSCNETIEDRCEKLLGLLDNYKGFFYDSNDSRAALPRFKRIITPLANMVECFRSDRFYLIDNEYQLENDSMCLSDHNLFFAALVFLMDKNATTLPPVTEYKIRMPDYLIGGTALMDRDAKKSNRPRDTPFNDMKYQYFGFSFLQDAVDRAIIEIQTNETQKVGVYQQQFPSPCYQINQFSRQVERVLPLLMVMAWVCSASLIIKNIVYEKEKRLKEFMKVMGLGNLVHWVAWFIQSFVFISFCVVVFCVIIRYGRITERTDFGVLLVFVLLFVIATICQCFMISTVFGKANVAAACGAVIYFLLYVPYWVVVQFAQEMTYPAKMASCLSAQVAFGWGCSYIAYYEGIAEGVNWNNINSPYSNTEFTLLDAMMMMLVDSTIYLFVTWYIEAAFPGEYGIPRPIYFPFTKSYWCGSKHSQKVLETLEDLAPEVKKYTESEPTQLPLGVAVRNLKKIYSNGKMALSGVSLNFYESQITSFLGHNGAGKTTTLSILTGLFPPTEGTVLVYGNDVRTRIEQIRKSLGMCPQHNILFGSLTVRQQLTFYAGLKGVPKNQIPDQVKEMINELALGPKADTPADDLSGGTQRRLAVAAAFIGGSKLVILDEPTAGVDPCARRLIWDLLLRKKEGRTIILSTHHMDEADVLGDRIAIIGAGKLICCGSSMFLKKCYGSGYRLTMVRKNPTFGHTQLLATGIPENEASNKSPSPSTSRSPVQEGKSLISNRSRISMEDVQLAAAGPDYDKMIAEFITASLPGAAVTEDVGQEFTYNVPSENPQALHAFFVELESKMDELNILSYGVSETKLEEIFLKAVGEEGGEEKAGRRCPNCCPGLRRKWSRYKKKQKNKKNPPLDDVNLVDSSDDESGKLTPESYIDPKIDLFEHSSAPVVAFRQLRALLGKRLLNFSRNIKGAFCEIVLPVVLVVGVLYILGFKPPTTSESGAVPLFSWLYGTPNYVFQKMDYPRLTPPKIDDSEWERIARSYLKALNEPPGLGIGCAKNYSLGICESPGNFTHVLPATPKPLQNYTCACDSRSIYQCPAGAYQPEPPVWYTNTSDYMVDLTGHDDDRSNISQWIMMTFDHYRMERFGGFSFGDHDNAAPNGSIDWNLVGNNVESMIILFERFSDAMGINWTSHRRSPWTSLDIVNGTYFVPMNRTERLRTFLGGLDYPANVKVWFNNQGWISGPAFASIFSNAVLRANLRATSPYDDPTEYGIVTINHPMNYTTAAKAAQMASVNIGKTTFEACMVMLAFCIVPASFVLFIIDETIAFSKHLQFVTGVRPVLYWASNFIWDIANFLIPVLLIMIVFVIFEEDAYIGYAKTALATFCLLFLYGFAIIPMMYPFTFVFKIPSLAFIMLTMGNAMIGWITTLTTMIYDMMSDYDESLIETNEIISTVFLFFPQFCLGRGLLDIKTAYYMFQGEKFMFGDSVQPPDLFRWDAVGRNMFCLLVEGCVWFIVTLLIEYRNELLRHFEGGTSHLDPAEDEDVKRERERITSSRNKEHYALKIKNLTKIFASGCGKQRKVLRAVDNLCVGIKPGECFGLLGVNGAGKTTTFSMLTGKLTVTSGDAFITGSSILSNMDKVCHQIGYCPQFDALHSLLTGREELRFYARLRGVKSAFLEKVVSRSILLLGLKPHADRQAGTYSGGNKRKLSTAIAMIGNPAVVLLDEPTTGMDPKARRFLWNRIMEVLRDGKTSVVLTSHSMEECEALCHRIGIMVNGRFRCLGSAQHLKSRFGQGYTLTIKIGGTKPKTEEAVSFIKNRFPGVELKEQHLSQLRFQLPPTIRALSDVFACMIDAMKVLHVDDYTLSQTTLEEVFVSFAQEQGATAGVYSRQGPSPRSATHV